MSSMNPSILDCTLRDGGYYTAWDFEDGLLSEYLAGMRGAKSVSTIEIGYRSNVGKAYSGRFRHMPRSLIAKCRERLRPDQKISIMLDEKDTTPEQIDGLLGDLRGEVEIIRFAIAPTRLDRAVDLVAACNALDFKVGLNVMYLNSYSEDASVLAPLADSGAASVALVDSYGGCLPKEVSGAIAAARGMLPQPIGFHGHDNISMAFANSLAALDAGALIIDSTVQGMGRGAGNTRTELLAAYFGSKLAMSVDYSALSTVVETFARLQKQHEWGTNLAYMVSGLEGLPQADVMDWLGTRRYGMGSIVAALRQHGEGQVDDTAFPDLQQSQFGQSLAGRPVLIIGGGDSIVQHAEALRDFARRANAVIVHSTTKQAHVFQSLEVSQIYCLAGQEITRLGDEGLSIMDIDGRGVVVQAPPRLPGTTPSSANVFQVESRRGQTVRGKLGPIADEPPLDLALSVAESLGAEVAYVAGFDGYAHASLADQQNARDVQLALDEAVRRWTDRTLISVTPSLYDVQVTSVYAMLQGEPA